MKKTVLFILILLVALCSVYSDTVASTSVGAFLNNIQSIGSYRIGFSSKEISSLTDEPVAPNNEDLEIVMPDGDTKGYNKKVYLFFQIISTDDINFSLSIRTNKLKEINGSDEIDWTIRWAGIPGIMAENYLNTKVDRNSLDNIFVFNKNNYGISIADSVLLDITTDDLDSSKFDKEYSADLTLKITVG